MHVNAGDVAMSAREVVLCHPVRTAIGGFNGSLKATPATELGAAVIRESIRRGGIDAADVGGVVFGKVVQAGNRMNPARQAAIGGDLPVSVPAVTVNRVCGSGAQAIATAADEVRLGYMDVAVAGGIGATGAVLTTRLLYAMQDDGIRRGIVTLCIGGGQGIALALETVS